MKKGFLVLLCFIVSLFFYGRSQNINTVNERGYWIDLGVGRSFLLSDLYGDKAYDKFINAVGGTDLFVRLNIKTSRNFGVAYSVNLIVVGRDKNPDKGFLFDRVGIDYNNFYINNYPNKLYTEWKESPEVGVKLKAGVFYEFGHRKWAFYPIASIGVQSSGRGKWFSQIKEKETNNAYYLSCRWGGQNYMLPFLEFQFKTVYKIDSNLGLNLGLNFSGHIINRHRFTAELTDYYDGTLINKLEKKSRLPNVLGISAGLSF